MSKYLLIVAMLITPCYHSLARAQVTNFVTAVSYFIDHIKQRSILVHNLDKYKKPTSLALAV